MELILISLSAAVGVFMILFFRTIALHRVSKKVFVILWYLVCLRLLIPISFSLIPTIRLPFVDKIQERIYQVESVSRAVKMLDEIPDDNLDAMTNEIDHADLYLEQIHDTTEMWINGKMIITVIWGIVAVIMLVILFDRYKKERQLLSQNMPLLKEDKMYLNSLGKYDWGEKVRVSDRTTTPLVYGIFSQTIILPKDFLINCKKNGKQENLCNVLLHETVHVKGHDNLWKLISRILLCIYWFQPLIWMMNRYFQRDLELFCDEKVLMQQGEAGKKAYAYTLLDLAEYSGDRRQIFSSGFGKKAVTERMEAVMKYQKKKLSVMISILIVFGVFTGMFCVGGAQSPIDVYKGKNAASIAIIGGADGPTSIFIAGKLDDGNNDEIQRVPITEAEINYKLDDIESIQPYFMDTLKEYQKWELKYDGTRACMFYNEKPVGFLQDRISSNVYLYGYTDARYEDDAVALYITRDSYWKKMGIESMDMNDERVGGGISAEDYEEVKKGMQIFDLQTVLDYSAKKAQQSEMVWKKVMKDYYERLPKEKQERLSLPEHTARLNCNMWGEEEIGTFGILFTGIEDEMEGNDELKQIMGELGNRMLEECAYLNCVEYGWKQYSDNPADAYGIKTVNQMGIRFGR